MQTDPIGYQDQMNLYAYVHNDPMNYTDPTGKIACGGACITGGAVLAYRGYKAYKTYKKLKKLRAAAAAAQAMSESTDSADDAGDTTPDEWDNVVWGGRDADGPYNPIESDSGSGGDNNGDGGDNNNDNNKKKDTSYNSDSEHKKHARGSTENKHEKANSRRDRDQGGEKGD